MSVYVTFRSQNRRLLQKIQQLEHQVNNLSPSSSLSSQTQVLDWEQHRHTETQVLHMLCGVMRYVEHGR